MDFDPFAPVTCAGCKKPVFASEKLTALKQVWHKGCLKCTTCGLTLNTNSLESYQNTPYCKAHKPNPKHSSVKSVVDQVATNVPKAARRVQGINKSSRMTFAPGAQGAIKPEGAVRPGGGPSRGGSSAASRAGAGAAAGTGTAAAVAAAAAYDDGAYDDQSYDQQQGGYEEGGYDESYAEGEGYYEGEGEGEGYYEGEGEGYYEGEGEGEGYYEGEEYHEGHGY